VGREGKGGKETERTGGGGEGKGGEGEGTGREGRGRRGREGEGEGKEQFIPQCSLAIGATGSSALFDNRARLDHRDAF